MAYPKPQIPEDEDDEDQLSEMDIFLMDQGLAPDGSRMTPNMIRPDNGRLWHPDDADGADPGREGEFFDA